MSFKKVSNRNINSKFSMLGENEGMFDLVEAGPISDTASDSVILCKDLFALSVLRREIFFVLMDKLRIN